MRVQFLKDNEPYQKGDVVDIADDRVDYLLDQDIAKKVDSDTPLFVKATGARQPEQEKLDKQIEQTEAATGRKAARTKLGGNAPKGKAKAENKAVTKKVNK